MIAVTCNYTIPSRTKSPDLQLDAFDKGHTEMFFDMWRQAVPVSFLDYHDFTMKVWHVCAPQLWT